MSLHRKMPHPTRKELLRWRGCGGRRRSARAVLAAGMALLAVGAVRPSHALDAPAVGSSVVRVQGAKALPIDGIWYLRSENRRVLIRNGRGVDADTGQPLSRNIRQTGPASFSLFDIRCNCPARMALTVEGSLMGTTGAVGWEITPVRLHDPQWFDEMRLGLN